MSQEINLTKAQIKYQTINIKELTTVQIGDQWVISCQLIQLYLPIILYSKYSLINIYGCQYQF